MTREPLSLRIELAPVEGEDAEALDDLSRALREELLVGVGKGALGIVARTVERWVQRVGDRSVVLELDGDRLEVSGISAEDQRRLIDTFVARHAGGEEWTAGSP